MQFDHEKRVVYRRSLDFVAFEAEISRETAPEGRNARDQLIRSSQSIPLNIAEGNGKRSYGERRRFFEIVRGSAMERAATLDVLAVLGALSKERMEPGKTLLLRVVAMLSKMNDMLIHRVSEEGDEYEQEQEQEQE
ncbi:MAG TPA: four helix bundle protein [Candidatus Hydrogenedentes bacterium]|nr:four helix bundle protein [Candidatus Hydrogenedentota bacterium]HOV74336.1 four helix bundle protein [Candidatus Hydrogenedentota bacterium]